MKLNLKNTEEFAKKIFSDKLRGSDLDWTLMHCELVLKTCILLSENKDVDIESLKIASWLHDIGRTEISKGHAEKSLEIAEKEFGELNPIIKDCLLNHGSSENPETKEGKIFQLAVMLSSVLSGLSFNAESSTILSI